MRRCKSGQRARIINDGLDRGTIVVINRPYFYPEKINDAHWPRVLHGWVITSLGAPLHSFHIGGGECPPAQTVVIEDRDLEPLDDDDDGLTDKETLERPKPKRRAKSKPVEALAGGDE